MKKQLVEGRIKRHPDGFGFLVPTDPTNPDVYIPKQSMKGAMTLDLVTVKVFAEGKDRFRGEIIDVVERGFTQIVGLLKPLNDRQALVKDDERGWGEDLKVDLKEPLDFKTPKLAAIEITSYPGDKLGFRGKLKEILGDAKDPLTDIKRVILSHNIPYEFSKKTEKEAAKFDTKVDPAKYKDRRNLMKTPLITIDGATAKDFDDAIFVETTKKGYHLIVAIADVSHYVKIGTALDGDAYNRGTSVYFPHYVVPMLPEVLSNELCSLKPNVPRLALVADIEFDYTGEKISSDFYEAIIQSHARVTYGEAQEVIDGNTPAKLKAVEKPIKVAADLAKILMARRFKNGSLDFEIPETQIVLDDSGQPIDIIKSQRLFAHRLIEEMMLSANVAVAEAFKAKEIPAIYRIHEPPQEGALQTLEKYVWNFGHKSNFMSLLKGQGTGAKGALQKKLTKLLQEFHGKPEGTALSVLTLRSMSQAKYAAENVGHFGLGFDDYTHFTSPIRRYPDLIVHRTLKAILKIKGYQLQSENELQTAGLMLSACEQRSVKAERNLIAIKKARFMEKHVGEEFDGIISSVTKFGVFVTLRTFEIDGLVKMESLSKEKLIFDEEHMRLRGARSGMHFKIGDAIRIKVTAANIQAGQIDFEKVIEKKIVTPSDIKASQTPEKKKFDPTAHFESLMAKLKGQKPGGAETLSFSSGRGPKNKPNTDKRESNTKESNTETANRPKKSFKPEREKSNAETGSLKGAFSKSKRKKRRSRR